MFELDPAVAAHLRNILLQRTGPVDVTDQEALLVELGSLGRKARTSPDHEWAAFARHRAWLLVHLAELSDTYENPAIGAVIDWQEAEEGTVPAGAGDQLAREVEQYLITRRHTDE